MEAKINTIIMDENFCKKISKENMDILLNYLEKKYHLYLLANEQGKKKDLSKFIKIF